MFGNMLGKCLGKIGYHPNDTINLMKSWGFDCSAFGKYKSRIRVCNRVDEQTEETDFFFYKRQKIIEELLKYEIWLYFY